MPLTPGTRLGTYDITALLGAGGMGEVYRARDTRLGRDVAIKVLPDSVASHADRLARFEREARSIAALNHPNVVTLYAIEEASGVRFLSMELVEGQTLDRLVTPGGLPVPRVLDLATPLADALVAAHEKGVVHRDLKPGNVMVTRQGRVKVLDFGLAKLASQDSGLEATQAETVAAPISTVGQAVGTVPYMAPEQLRGEAVDARTDLFSFGVMLFELVSGRRPFGGATSAEVSSAILRDPPAPLEQVRTDLPRDVARIIGRCLEKDPERRFQTAKDVRNELDLVRRSLQPAAAPAAAGLPAAIPTARDVPSIAVLPFANRSRDEEDEYFAEGLADELLNVLAKIRGLRVAARTSSSQFKDTADDLATIGRKLNVATLLEGSVRKAGNRVRIAVQLVKVADGYQLWSETFDRTLDDIFAVQDDIAQSVVKELRTTLMGETADSKASGEVKAEVAAAAEGRGTNAEAHRLFLQGRYFVNRFGAQDVARGIELLHQALAIEPGHALAWANLSWAETFMGISGGWPLEAAIARAREAASRSLALRPDLPEALHSLAWVQLYYDFDWKGAEASFRQALEASPGHPDFLRSYGMILTLRGRYEEGLARCREGIEKDPLSAGGYGAIGRIYLAMKRWPEAEDAFRRALEISPNATSMHSLISITYFKRGKLDEALAEVRKEPAEWARLYTEAIIQHALGNPEASRKAKERLVETGADTAAVQIAIACAMRGEPDEAFQWLEHAYEKRDSGLAYMKSIDLLEPLHDDPRWQAFLEKMNFPE